MTKSLHIEQSMMLIELSRDFESVSDWKEEALFQLPQPSRQRRQEIVRTIEQKFLPSQDDRFLDTPLRYLLTLASLDSRFKRDLLYVQYLRTTPLIWHALNQIVLPHAEAAAQPMARPDAAEIEQDEWDDLLRTLLKESSDSTFAKTRQHITAHLSKFGPLEAHGVERDRIAKRFFARFYEPDPKAFWFSLAMELTDQGSATRSLDYLTERSWTRVAFCTRTTYARYAIEEAGRMGLTTDSYFGSDKQITFRGPDPVANVVEVIRYG